MQLKQSLATLICALEATKCSAFVASPLHKTALQSPAKSPHKSNGRTLFMVTTGIEPDSKVTEEPSSETPTTVFGRPIDDDAKEFNKAVVGTIKSLIFDTLFTGKDRDYARFYALETIARMPYFSYLSVLHLYETLGMWRQKNYLKIHFAEEWNELHHLLIMEELGGNKNLLDRLVAQVVSVGYFWIVYFLYMFNPTLAYNMNQAVEEHAYATYDEFLKENEEKLKLLPATQVAKDYYQDGDLYMFDEFQTGTCEPRRPKCDTLYDVFVNVRDDEKQHINTMISLQGGKELHTVHEADECELSDEFFAS